MTKIIVSGRGAGKTEKVIRESYEKGLIIVCQNQTEAHNIFEQAKKLGLNIPEPLSVNLFKNNKFFDPKIFREGVIVENADVILESLLSVPVETITLSGDKVQLLDYDKAVYNPTRIPPYLDTDSTGHTIRWKQSKRPYIGQKS